MPQTGLYVVIKLEAKVPIDVARRMVKEEVAEETKVSMFQSGFTLNHKIGLCKRNPNRIFYSTYG